MYESLAMTPTIQLGSNVLEVAHRINKHGQNGLECTLKCFGSEQYEKVDILIMIMCRIKLCSWAILAIKPIPHHEGEF